MLVGKPDASILIKRVMGTDGQPRMPLGFPPVPKDDIDKIRAWISSGAHTEGADSARHWAYVKPIRPIVPQVHNKAWVRNPIDSFVLARLEQERLKPSPEASKETLIRRVSLDLIGLPLRRLKRSMPSWPTSGRTPMSAWWRSAVGIATLRGAPGATLARFGPLCRLRRI